MQGRRVLISGCGDIGSALALRLHAAGCHVTGLRRDAARMPEAITRIGVDLGDADAVRAALGGSFDTVVVATAAGQFDAAVYRRVYVDGLRNLLAALHGAPRVLLVSSTSVYHQDDGAWIDEDSPTEPTRFPGQIQLEAERLLRDACGERASVVRFGGIYGPGRERLLGEVRAGIGCAREPLQFGNRIHRDDCVGILDFLLRLQTAGAALAPLYLGVDSEPATQWEVRHWLAERLGITLDDSRGTPNMRGPGSKRCSNRRLLAAGYTFLYPTFREGYAALLA